MIQDANRTNDPVLIKRVALIADELMDKVCCHLCRTSAGTVDNVKQNMFKVNRDEEERMKNVHGCTGTCARGIVFENGVNHNVARRETAKAPAHTIPVPEYNSIQLEPKKEVDKSYVELKRTLFGTTSVPPLEGDVFVKLDANDQQKRKRHHPLSSFLPYTFRNSVKENNSSEVVDQGEEEVTKCDTLIKKDTN